MSAVKTFALSTMLLATGATAFASEGGGHEAASSLKGFLGLPITNSILTSWVITIAIIIGVRLLVGTPKIIPSRGQAIVEDSVSGLRDLYEPVQRGVARAAPLKECFDAATEARRPKYGSWPIFEHCQPFNVARAYDEAQGIDTPRIWTAERDRTMWAALQG